MKRKMLSIISIIFSLILLFINVSYTYTYAAGDSGSGISQVFDGVKKFEEVGKDKGPTVDEDQLKNTSNLVYNILLILGIGLAVVIGAILGIKFMIGSVEEKAQIKDALIPFALGCVVIFGAFGIWKFIVTIGNNL